jgi:hypothetical protein
MKDDITYKSFKTHANTHTKKPNIQYWAQKQFTLTQEAEVSSLETTFNSVVEDTLGKRTAKAMEK